MRFLFGFVLSLVFGSAFCILGGDIASTKVFSYQAGIMFDFDEVNSGWCGGALINNEWVLTVAHCASGAISADVNLGATKRSKSEITHKVGKNNIIVHPSYNPANYENDIALIKIPKTSSSVGKIKPAKIADVNAGSKVIASGWGDASVERHEMNEELKFVELNVIDNDKCVDTYGEDTPSSIVCIAIDGKRSACGGDSGGPLVLASNKALVGLTSYGADPNCKTDLPAVFTRVASYKDWINSNTGIKF